MGKKKIFSCSTRGAVEIVTIQVSRNSLVTQRVKDPVLSVLWLWKELWHGFDLRPGNFCMLKVWGKKKKTLSNETH